MIGTTTLTSERFSTRTTPSRLPRTSVCPSLLCKLDDLADPTAENKDIPEGGAKGTILPFLDANYKQCFQKYVDVGDGAKELRR
jgi:hypothetical protein